MALLEIDGLRTEFRLRQETIYAVDDLSLTLDPGETLAVVGESGSGKTALALSILRLHPQPPCAYPSGRILLNGTDLLTLPERRMGGIRGKDIGMVFQDPMTSLDPVQVVGRQVAEAVQVHRGVSRAKAARIAVDALEEVGIPNPARRALEYPHQFSGGMRQRAMIAMALVCRPRVLIADEPTTALDVTIQAQILELLAQLQQRHDTAILLITHDLGVVAQVADRVLVMYSGRAVESATAERVFSRPLMPYTLALLESTPRLDAAEGAELRPVPGQPPSMVGRWQNCPFTSRCSFVIPDCHQVLPQLTEREPGHSAACLLPADEIDRRRAATGTDRLVPEA